MDLAGMGPTHQITTSSGLADEDLTDEEIAERQAKTLEDRKTAAQARKDASDAEIAQLQEETERGVAAANEAFELIKPAIDPLAAVAETDPAPVKDKTPSPDPFKTKK